MVVKLSYHQGTQDTKLDCLWKAKDDMWAFQMRRAQSEMVKIGWGEAHSPVTITTAGLKAVEPFLDKFLPFYVTLLAKNPDISEAEMTLAFEHEFGDYILQQICIPNGLVSGSCLLAITQACKMRATNTK